MDPTAQNVGVGGVLFLSALWMFLKFKPWERKNGNGNGKHGAPKSGELDPEVWKAEIRRIIQEENESLMNDLRLLLEARTGTLVKELREPLMKNIDDTRHTLANGMQTVVGALYQTRKKPE